MKSPYVSELQPNQLITGTFLVRHKDIRQKKSGEPYLSLALGDRTGDIDAKMWDNAAEVLDSFERDDFVRTRGLVQVHQNRLQLTIHKLQAVSADQTDAADFFPASDRDVQEMWAELRATVDSLSNPHLKHLLTAIFDDEEIARRFKIAPAAKTVHHAFLGGLMEHVLSMCGLARMMATHYKDIDLDLLYAGVLLHDIGKIHELTYDKSFNYSSEGQLLGHINIGLRMVGEKLQALPDFPPKLRTLLEHMIISHHGELEFGSTRQPMFAEALLLHHIDNIDSKVECVRAFTSKDRSVEGCWTGYNPSLDRSFLKKQKYLDDTPLSAPKVQQAVAASTSTPVPVAKTLLAEKLMGALKGGQ